MGKLSGQTEYEKFLEGKSLSPKQAIKAQCFSCNGEKEGSSEDCKGLNCPLYPFFRKWLLKGRKSIVAAGVALFLLCQCIGIGICHADVIDDLVPAIIQVESGGNANAVSPAGAVGLMQITPIVIKEYEDWVNKENCGMDLNVMRNYTNWGVKEWMIPEYNIKLGVWYLRRLKNHYLKGNYTIERMLAAYNGGITRLRKVNYDVNRMPKETREYVRKVMKIYRGANMTTSIKEMLIKATCISCQREFWCSEAYRDLVQSGREESICGACSGENQDDDGGDKNANGEKK